jgi:peptidyl-prolyl cis-trans isomerase B (cyclophilin B)
VIQGGCPEGTGFGGADETIKGEFSINGVTNTLPHLYGTISMARTQDDYDSASSQFFICHRDNSSLDGNYAAFGYTIYGLDVLNAIATTETQTNNMPLQEVVINSIKFVDITE